jgi:hypothetical protein
MHRPSSVNELKLAICDKTFNLLMFLSSLVVPPLFKKGNFNFCKLSFWVGRESVHHGRKLNVDISELDVFTRSVEVLIESFEPSNIVMGMRSNVDCPWIRLWLIFQISLIFNLGNIKDLRSSTCTCESSEFRVHI